MPAFSVLTPIVSRLVVVLYLTSVLVGVCGVQEFVQEPEDQQATQGNTVVLQCVVKNRANGPVQWTRGGFGLGIERDLPYYPRYTMIGATVQGADKIEEFSLKIVDVQLEDDSRYQCQVQATEEIPGIQSRYANLEVLIPPSPPEIEGGPTLAVIMGQPTNITCTARDGKPQAKITWFKDGIRIDDKVHELATIQSDGKRVETTGIVTITASESDAGKKLECAAHNLALQGKEPYKTYAILDIQYPPKVQMVMDNDRVIREYELVEITCTGTANPFGITWKWYRDGAEIEGATSSTLKISSITRDFHGNIISCEATNSVGNTLKQYQVNIHYGPQFIGEPRHVNVEMNEAAELYCEADGNPAPSIIWRRKGEFRALSSKSRLRIARVGKGDFGVYVCTATVLGFNEVSREIYLTQNGVPQIVSDKTQYAGVGDRASIQCLSISSPKPENMIWRNKRGEVIDYATSGRFSATEEDLPYGRKSILQILNVHDDDFGSYNCTVKNAYGNDTVLINLVEKAVLPLPVIIGSVVGGIAVIFIIVITCIIYHKCRHSSNDSYAETDSNTEIKKRDKNESPTEFTKSTLMDQWRQDYKYRCSVDYDEDQKGSNNGYSSYSTDHYSSQDFPNGHVIEYTTAVPDEVIPEPRFESSYNTGYIPSTFRSGSRTDFIGRNDLHEPYRLPPADLSTTKLATNV
ncbi:hypothetical protein ACJMK2_025823 [Sinanodonta woodiana]|uniref:Ig-like domain-containing protein n=1 Tax=Sinanodonta woodiana TaxID=1069815 RepID=A0ABD3XI72_SINWO